MLRTWRVVVAVALITIVGVGFSCRDATAVRLAIYTDVAWDNGRAVLLAANRSAAGSTEPQAAITSPWSSPYLGDIVLLPSSEPSLYVTVVMGVTRDAASCRLDAPDGCIVARRRTSFIEHKTLTVPVTMHASCLGVACSEDRTCNALGLCVSADVPASSCESPQGVFCLVTRLPTSLPRQRGILAPRTLGCRMRGLPISRSVRRWTRAFFATASMTSTRAFGGRRLVRW